MEHISPLITAHAGCMQTPPNSVDNLLKGIEAGADILEFDVNATKDGVPVLFHDRHIRLSPHQNLPINELTYTELQKIETTILRLEDILDRVQPFRKALNLDLKSLACVKPMAEAVKFRNMVDDVVLSGCNKEHAFSVKKMYPEFQVLLNTDQNTSLFSDSEYKDYMIRTCRDAVAALCCGLNMHYKDFRREMLFYARLRCLPVLIYTVDEIREMERLVLSGVHSITTNKVETLLALKARGHLS